jgi:acetolactate synthase small subunit
VRLRNEARVVFVISALNDGNVLARVVMLLHRLNVEIDAIWMVRRRKSESMRIHVTVQASRDHAARLEAQIAKIVSVTSVGIEPGAERRVDDERTS